MPYDALRYVAMRSTHTRFPFAFPSRAVDTNQHLHGCNVLYELVKPWANTDAVVVADSYFASVPAAIRLKEAGLRFIGTIKTATREFPMEGARSVNPYQKGLKTPTHRP